ncbi:MAG: DUF1801 domain-containing protein [Bacteroidetes bacterium]|nr:DUF1801 domain-containing protein [Bacteroidota bacterium]
MQSKASTIQEYVQELPDERKDPMRRLIEAIRKNIPAGFSEGMGYGMPAWFVSHANYPKGYHANPKLPLPFLNVASQKNHIAFYYMALYKGPLLDWFTERWNEVCSYKLDMGKGCIRFKKPAEIPFDLLGELVSKVTPEMWISYYESVIKH